MREESYLNKYRRSHTTAAIPGGEQLCVKPGATNMMTAYGKSNSICMHSLTATDCVAKASTVEIEAYKDNMYQVDENIIKEYSNIT